jgi:RecA-family ATPase
MSAPISLPPHPKWGAASEAYGYTRDDGMRCVQAKYRNGAASPKHCAWWVQGTDGEYYVSHGDVKLERLRPYNAALLNNPHARHEPIILCEGPKDADALVGLGFVASDHRSLVGAHADWFRGRDVVIIQDRDAPSSATDGGGYRGHPPGKTPGERAAARAKRLLLPVAKRLAVVTMPGDGVKDAAQWVALQTGTTAEKANILCGMFNHALACGDGTDAEPAVAQRGVVIDFPAWQGRPLPEREWLVPGWLPLRHVTSLYGDGGTGKSLLAQQLMTASAIGASWLGLQTMRCRTYGLLCEDGYDEILLRQRDINNDLGIDFADLADMHVWSLLGDDAVLMTFDHRGRGELTELWHELHRRVLDFGARLLVVDTAADTFGGNEIIRGQVRHFIRACLGRLALDMNGAVLLCAHPSRSGLVTGEGDGGSTAWSNSVRSRLFFARPNDGADSGNARVLTRKKANYAAAGDEIRVDWRNGVFVPEGTPAVGVLGSIEKRNAETAFVEALDQATAAGRNLSDSKNAGNYAPKVLQQMPAGRGFKTRDLERAMNQLFGDGKIRMADYGPPSNGTRRIQRIAQ